MFSEESCQTSVGLISDKKFEGEVAVLLRQNVLLDVEKYANPSTLEADAGGFMT